MTSWAPWLDLPRYTQRVWRRKGLIVGVVLLSVGLAYAYCAVSTPVYEATATVLLQPNVSPLLSIGANAPAGEGAVNVPSQLKVMESSVVADLVAKQVPHAPTLTATQVGRTDVIHLTVSSTNPHVAARAANAYARAFLVYERGVISQSERTTETMLVQRSQAMQSSIAALGAKAQSETGSALASDVGTLQTEETQLGILQGETQRAQLFESSTPGQTGTIITYASVPTEPSSPKTLEYCLVAAGVGLAIGVLLALSVEAVHPKPQRRHQRSRGHDHVDVGQFAPAE
jgi:uncharacterized protein involved in exopolysaccharide biosynthesis